MPHGTAVRGRPGTVLLRLLLGVALLGASGSLTAQERTFQRQLVLKREFPGSGPFVCPAVTTPAPPLDSDRLQATQLASSADQALVLGDLSRAATLMARATELDPSSPDLAYRRGRVLEELGDGPAAIDAYCRAVAAGAEDDLAADAEARIQELADARWAGISVEAARVFRLGLSAADLGRFSDAAGSFGSALAEAPDWADAAFNRALMFERLGESEAALADLRRYLSLRPDAVDAVAVSGRIGQLEGASAVAPSAGTALAVGLVIPGMGQFYSGRGRSGAAFLALAGGAAAAGFLIEEVQVECLVTVGSGQDCPAGQIFRETSERPYLAPALGVAAGIAVIGAIEAFVKARRRGPAVGSLAAAPAPAPGELRLAWPTVTQRGVRVDFNVLRLTF